jgi:hypothetical protein
VRYEDRTVYGQEWLNVAKCCKYLGITLQTNDSLHCVH